MVEIRKIAALGEVLIQEGLITPEVLEAALLEQQECGSRLGQILIGQGYLNNLKLYKAIAKHYNLEFADLRGDPVDASLLHIEDRDVYRELGVMPWRKDGEQVVYAVTELSPLVMEWIKRQRDHKYSIAITSPMDIAYATRQHFFQQDDDYAREALWRVTPENSAKTLLGSKPAKLAAILLCAGFFALLFVDKVALPAFIGFSLFYAVTLVFKVLLLVAALTKRKYTITNAVNNKDAPVYTILVPLFREEGVLVQLVQAIRNLDYPKSKLDVKLIVEESDTGTLQAIKALRCESYFEIITVPYSLPQTKPKACNYALHYAKGEYLTIYDAEDIPHPAQLKQVLSLFRSDANIACVQAKLNYYNREENLLTRMFSLEYGIWFDFLLQGLERLKLPIPLGGTSNHIKLSVLKSLHAWDPYNVTEDADLGVRLAAHGYKTAMVDSLTLEESPISVGIWLKQRSRWIKGYMQTYLVYMRRPLALYQQLGARGFWGFQLFIGAPCLTFLISPIMWGVWLVISLYGWERLFSISPPMTALFWFNLAVGLGLQIGLASAVVLKHRWQGMLAFIGFFPFYWVLHSIASIRALWQLIVKPHWWEKTNHGLSKYQVVLPK